MPTFAAVGRWAASFAAACADIWNDLEQRALHRATSVGEFMDRVNEAVFDQLDGAPLSFERVCLGWSGFIEIDRATLSLAINLVAREEFGTC